MLSAAAPARVTVGAAARLPVALRALSPARATVEAEVRLDAELSADAAFRTLSGSAASDELAVRLAVVRMTTKRPTAVELKARSMLADTLTGGWDEPVALNDKSMLALTSVNTSAAAVMLPEAVRLAAPRNDAVDAYTAEPWVVSAALAGCTRVPTASMLLLAVRLDAPTWVSPVKFSVTRLSPLSVIRRSPLSVMRGPSSNEIVPSSESGDDARGLKPNIVLPFSFLY